MFDESAYRMPVIVVNDSKRKTRRTRKRAAETDDSTKAPTDPFAPECSVPLPVQIGDEYGCASIALLLNNSLSSYVGPNTVWRRNERERHRVRCVNDGYEALRACLPNVLQP